MEYYSTIFRQILSMIPKSTFDRTAKSGGYNRYTKHFTVWSQFVTNLYTQISGKNSLREVENCLTAQQNHLYHLGIRNVSKSQLAYVNKKRDFSIFKELFYSLSARFDGHLSKKKFKFKNRLYILDSTLIRLSLTLFPWAKYRKAKGAMKIHALLDQRATIPSFIDFSEGRAHDIKKAESMTRDLLPDSIITMDKAYLKFKWLYDLHCRGIYFVVRAKNTMDYEIVGQHKPVPDRSWVIDDKWITLNQENSRKDYPENLRMIWFYDDEKGETYEYLTNNKTLSSSTIAAIYKARWDIETFFKWIKGNLKIKHFLGNTENAVMTQVWTAMIYHLVLAYIKFQTRCKFSLLRLAWIISETLMKKMDIIDLLRMDRKSIKSGQDPGQQRVLINIT